MARTRKIKTIKASSPGKTDRKFIHVFGGKTTVTDGGVLSLRDLNSREVPTEKREAFERAREWHKTNAYVEHVCRLQRGFYNYGFELCAIDPAKDEALDKWLEDEDNHDRVMKFRDDVWSEWLVQDNLVSFWRVKTPPYQLLPEKCTYTNAMWNEVLKVRLDIKKDDLKNSGMTDKQIERYTKGEITLSEEFGEFYRVTTRELMGCGFGWPRMYRSFRTLSQNESMEVGESMLAFLGRMVARQHKIGFEVKNATSAMKQPAFLYKPDRARAIENFFANRQGGLDVVTQFDHSIDYVWPDAKHYAGDKWATIQNRLIHWAGPVGYMMTAVGLQPFLLTILRTQAAQEREIVGKHIARVLNDSIIPVDFPVRIEFSNRIFTEPRLAWDMVKSLMQQGPLSLRTGLEEADFDPDDEAEIKIDEAKKENDPKLLPKFDPNHGQKPAGKPGHPSGNSDATGPL